MVLYSIFCRCGQFRDRPDRVHCHKCRERPKRETFNAYGGALCVYCGCDDLDALNLEHRYDDGHEDKRRGLAGQKLYRFLKRAGYPKRDRFDVACANCNQIKRIRGIEFLRELRGAA